MPDFYGREQRALQQHFETERLADLLAEYEAKVAAGEA
jgi:hypothetical protein